ncbi:MAG: SRPBCC family protein [Acidimicrobiales bacterium]
MTTQSIAPVVHERTVRAPVDTCFRVFVDGFGTWWPPEHHIGENREITAFTIEPLVGGRCFDTDTSGTECHWGTVLAYEPPTRLVLAWHIQGDWQIDLDPAKQSEVTITFTDAGDGTTAVRLEHSKIERHDLPENVAGPVASEGGWPFIVGRFVDRVEGREPRPHGAG